MCAVGTRSENPDRNVESFTRNGSYLAVFVFSRKISLDFPDVLRKPESCLFIPPQRVGSDSIRSRSPSQTQIDPSRIQGFQCAKLFGNYKRRSEEHTSELQS